MVKNLDILKKYENLLTESLKKHIPLRQWMFIDDLKKLIVISYLDVLPYEEFKKVSINLTDVKHFIDLTIKVDIKPIKYARRT